MIEEQLYPILEYDAATEAIIEPKRVTKPLEGIPQRAVLCFFQDVISRLVQEHQAHHIHNLTSEIGKHPIYELQTEKGKVVVAHPGVGAPLAAGLLEELIALGCSKFIACGGAGVLNRQIVVGHVVVPSSAIRDEGTSYHYLPPSREVAANPQAVAAIEEILTAHHIPFVVGKTWTTDAFFRETRGKMARRQAEGCVTVEMEAAAFFAVAQFRGVEFGQLLYGGDDLTGDAWEDRSWTNHSGREKLFWLAAEACQKL